MNLDDFKKENEFDSYQEQPKNKLLHFFKVIFFIFLVFFIIASAFSYKTIFSQETFIKGLGQLPIVKQIRQIVGAEKKLTGIQEDRVNFIISGQGGLGHDGPYLTDTIILGSTKPSTGQTVFISIPRDLLVEIPGKGWYKINSVNSFGETENYPGGGSALLAKTVGDVFGITVHYWLRIDFNAFENIIDKVGGVEVCVNKEFTDNLYPAADHLYQTVSFAQGCQKMDGATALVFARSRHGNNGEGSDFARAARQQQIILAIKDKLFNWKTVFNPSLIYSIFNMADKNVQTNIKKNEIPAFVDLASKATDQEIQKRVLDNSPSGLLQDDITSEGAYVLKPRSGDYTELRNLVQNIFVLAGEPQQPTQPTRLAILNGTEKEGLARDTAGLLYSLNYQITSTGNAPEQNYEKTVVYDLTGGTKKDALRILKQSLNANVATELPPDLENSTSTKDVDFVIILGKTEIK
ncbi:MAG TPA: LCP family protein [bacterium]|nr:LCP family protein [bacterium]